MTVLFLLENSAKNPAGGTDISSNHLASLLRKKKIRVIEWAPYQGRRTPFWYTSLLFLPWLILKTLIVARREKIDLVHIQGKYLIPVGVIAARLLRVPVIATIRDYVVCCPIGLCLFNEAKRHGFFDFLLKEIPEFLVTYHSGDVLMIRIIRTLLLIRAWVVTKWLRWWTRKADAVISVSNYVAEILKMCGISSTVIYNCFDVSKYRKILRDSRSSTIEEKMIDRKTILFVGKSSYGKGSDLFDKLSAMKEFSQYRFIKMTTDRWTSYGKVLLAMRDALVTVVPGRWQEPFGRVALESLMVGTPVVATKRGGLPEIVEHERTGMLADPTVSSLSRTLEHVIEKHQLLKNTIRQNRKSMHSRFSSHPVEQHLILYREVLGKIGHR